jgi:hypothetical protein
MSFGEDEISNLVRSFLFGGSVTDRFDTMMSKVLGYTQTLLPRSLPPTHTSQEREGIPPLSRSHKGETDVN